MMIRIKCQTGTVSGNFALSGTFLAFPTGILDRGVHVVGHVTW